MNATQLFLIILIIYGMFLPRPASKKTDNKAGMQETTLARLLCRYINIYVSKCHPIIQKHILL
jgi:hypothetical protein